MMINELNEYMAIMARLEKVYGTLPKKAATIAVNFSKDRFRQQNWIGNRTEPWKKRKFDDKNSRRRAILVKSGKLKRDVQKIYVSNDKAIIGTSTITIDYAKLHNEGGMVNAVANVPSHKRKTHSRVREGRKEKVKGTVVKQHQRRVKFRMPKRQFLGASPVMDKQIERMITAELLKAIRKAN